MAYQGIGTGTSPNDNTGDSLLTGAVKINSNFEEIYNALGDGTNITFSETDLNERIQDTIGSAINSGIQTGISVTYDDENNKIDFSVSDEYIQDTMGSVINSGIQTGISVTYDDENNRINFFNDVGFGKILAWGHIAGATGQELISSENIGEIVVNNIPTGSNIKVIFSTPVNSRYAVIVTNMRSDLDTIGFPGGVPSFGVTYGSNYNNEFYIFNSNVAIQFVSFIVVGYS